MSTVTSSGRLLAPGSYGLSDLRVGDHYDIGAVTVTETMIDTFADLTGDRFEIHMRDDAARAYGFKRRVAHGLLVQSLVDGLKNRSPVRLKAVASLGWDWTFAAPVLAGAEVRAEIRVEATRPTRNPERGIATLALQARDQTGARVQHGINRLMMLT